MALDRFVSFASLPSALDCDQTIRGYFGPLGSVSYQPNAIGGYWLISLGSSSGALAWSTGRDPWQEERFIEVWRHEADSKLDVITRSADELTSALAEGLVGVFCRFFVGEREDDGDREVSSGGIRLARDKRIATKREVGL